MSSLKTPIIVNIVGEGGSGGALALGVGDHINMMEHATYSVASPEACASIVWRDSEMAAHNFLLYCSLNKSRAQPFHFFLFLFTHCPS